VYDTITPLFASIAISLSRLAFVTRIGEGIEVYRDIYSTRR
jgi:hypothetical protein